MTLPRSELVDLEKSSFYHCIVRCVRRSFLCGIDTETGQDFSHRKKWIEERILHLSTIFSIKVCAYAVMSNHYHTVLYIDEAQAKSWEDQEVIERWKMLFPKNAEIMLNSHITEVEVAKIIALWRERLSSLSWYMRCLNEPIARSSNDEDDCTGRFWEGRFKSKIILDEGALLTTMAYVDLNPIRANQACVLEESEFTSIYERIKAYSKALNKNSSFDIENMPQPKRLMAFSNGKNQSLNIEPMIDFKLLDYLKLVDETGRIIRDDKRGAIPETLTPILTRLNLTPRGWLDMVKDLEHSFFHAIGSESNLLVFGKKSGFSRLPKGGKAARRCYVNVA